MVIDRFFNEIGVTPHVLMRHDDTEAIKRLVESGFAATNTSRACPEGAFALLFRSFASEGHCLKRSLALAARVPSVLEVTESIASFHPDTWSRIDPLKFLWSGPPIK